MSKAAVSLRCFLAWWRGIFEAVYASLPSVLLPCSPLLGKEPFPFRTFNCKITPSNHGCIHEDLKKCLLLEEIADANSLAERFGFKMDLVDANIAATVIEAFLISILQDDSLEPLAKKRRIDREVTGLQVLARQFDRDIDVHKRVLAQATQLLLRDT